MSLFRASIRGATTSKIVRSAAEVRLLHFNVGNLLPKLDSLKIDCNDINPHIVCISKTWLDKEISDTELTIIGYNLARLDRNRQGGGVDIYINADFAFNVICAGNLN